VTNRLYVVDNGSHNHTSLLCLPPANEAVVMRSVASVCPLSVRGLTFESFDLST